VLKHGGCLNETGRFAAVTGAKRHKPYQFWTFFTLKAQHFSLFLSFFITNRDVFYVPLVDPYPKPSLLNILNIIPACGVRGHTWSEATPNFFFTSSKTLNFENFFKSLFIFWKKYISHEQRNLDDTPCRITTLNPRQP